MPWLFICRTAGTSHRCYQLRAEFSTDRLNLVQGWSDSSSMRDKFTCSIQVCNYTIIQVYKYTRIQWYKNTRIRPNSRSMRDVDKRVQKASHPSCYFASCLGFVTFPAVWGLLLFSPQIIWNLSKRINISFPYIHPATCMANEVVKGGLWNQLRNQ